MFKKLLTKIKRFFVKEPQLLTDAEIRQLIKESFIKFGFENNTSFESKFSDYFNKE